MPLVFSFLSRLDRLATSAARADVVLMIEEPINLLRHISATGHSALLLTNLCSDDHLHIRACREGEPGTVISRYQGAYGYDWLAIAPLPYLYPVDSPTDIPEQVSAPQVDAMRALYLRRLTTLVPARHNDAWMQWLGSSYRRRIVCIRLHTTEEQDQRLMNWLNSHPNHTRFNFLYSNCADFTRCALNVLFPGAVRRNVFFDAGLTTPKQLAASLHHYANKYPAVDFHVETIPQIPGDIPRSGRIRGVTESFVKTTPYCMALWVLNPLPFSGVIASGLLDHRYNPFQDTLNGTTLRIGSTARQPSPAFHGARAEDSAFVEEVKNPIR